MNIYNKNELDVAIAKAIEKAYNPDGFNILNNCNEAAGQTVMHFHVHIIPRYKNDDLKIKFVDHSNTSNLDEIQKDILANID